MKSSIVDYWSRIKAVPHLVSIVSVTLVTVLFFLTRLYYLGSDANTYDHGNHLIIAYRIANNIGIAYVDFAVSHMPGLYYFMSLGYLFGDSELHAMFPYIVVSFSIVLSLYIYLKLQYKSVAYALIGALLLIFDSTFLIYNIKSTADILTMAIVLPLVYYLMLKKSRFKSSKLMFIVGLVIGLCVFIKLSSIMFFIAFILTSYIAIERRLRLDALKPYLTSTLGFLIGLFIVAVYSSIINENIAQDVYLSVFYRHALRGFVSIFYLLVVSLSSTVLYFFIGVLVVYVISRKKLELHLAFSERFSILFVFSYFIVIFVIQRTFYPHHILFVVPFAAIAICGVLKLLKDSKKFDVPRRKSAQYKINILFGTLFLLTILVLNLHVFINVSVKSIQNVPIFASIEEEFVYYDNTYNMLTGKSLEKLGYYSTVPDITANSKSLCIGDSLRECTPHLWLPYLESGTSIMFPRSNILRPIYDYSKDYGYELCSLRVGVNSFFYLTREDFPEGCFLVVE